jgi:plasmid maintenance system antidote protein VapI
MPEIPARFWLNLETDYQLSKALVAKNAKTV